LKKWGVYRYTILRNITQAFSGTGEIPLIPKKDRNEIIADFRLRQGRQLLGIAVALLLIVLLAMIHHRSDLFGNISKSAILSMQAMVIAAFIGFTSVNWRCPSCNKYLGSNIYKRGCSKCGAGFQ
jgi:hypothetical protein